MRAIGITGFKDSGKTGLTGRLAAALERMGRKVAVLKFTHHGLDLPGTDTHTLSAPGRMVAAVSDGGAALFFNERISVLDFLPRFSADILLVEGGKNLTFLPRILCLHDVREAEMLAPKLAVATYGPIALPPLPAFREGSVAELARLVDEKAFMLGGLDCALCGRDDCAGLAWDILCGRAQPSDCTALKPESIEVRVNGCALPLNAFTAAILNGAFRGALAPLKGMAPGTVEITLKQHHGR